MGVWAGWPPTEKKTHLPPQNLISPDCAALAVVLAIELLVALLVLSDLEEHLDGLLDQVLLDHLENLRGRNSEGRDNAEAKKEKINVSFLSSQRQ